MRRYRTEIVIPTDRYVGLQLPADLPEGRATITIQVEEPDDALDPFGLPAAPDHDIEWWDEFGDQDRADDDGDEPWGLHGRLSALEA